MNVCVDVSTKNKHLTENQLRVKESACDSGDPGLILGWGRSPGEENGYPLQYSCLEIPWTEEPGSLWIWIL